MRGRKDKVAIDNSAEDLFEVRQTALELAGQNNVNIDDVFFMDTLEQIEHNIKSLNEYSDKCWLLSSILLYSLVYNKEMYTQSGLSWQEYVAHAKQRLGLSKDDISRQLSGARFFIAHHQALKLAGWTPLGGSRKLALAGLALENSGDLNAVIQHLVNDSVREFVAWYTSFKNITPQIEVEDKRPDILITDKGITIGGINAVTISDKLPENEKNLLEKYLGQIYTALKQGDVPAIVPCYDENEAKSLIRLRDKNRQKK